MRTTMPAGLRDKLIIPTPAGPDPVEFVGSATWGGIYRATAGHSYYRVLRSGEAPIEAMQGARDWADAPSKPEIVPVTDVSMWFEDDGNYSYIRYTTAAKQTLQEVLQESPPAERLRHLARALRSLHTWRNYAGSGLWPMPAEIVILENGDPMLLAAPFRPPTSLADIMACPVRAYYVSPEQIRGTGSTTDDADSLYAFAAMSALALHRPVELSPEEALLHAANRTLLNPVNLQGTLPRWMDKLDAIREMRTESCRLLAASAAERRGVSPEDFASRLEEWGRRCEPITAVMSLHQRGRIEEASNLLREILSYQETYELLTMGAALLAATASFTLEGIEYLERALTLTADRKDSYAAQLALITRKPEIPSVPTGGESPEWGTRLEEMLWRDFNGLPDSDKPAHEHRVAQFLIARGEFETVATFVYPRLFDRNNVYLWWKFDMVLDYAEALLGKGTLPEAAAVLSGAATGIERARASRSVRPDILSEASARHGRLAQRLGKVQREMQRPLGGVQ
jgi:hypothetical protein